VVPFSGTIDVLVDGQEYLGVGGRSSVFDGPGDSVYGGARHPIRLRARSMAEVAIAGGRTDQVFAPFRVRPEEVLCVEIGSSDTKSKRRLCHLLGQNGAGRAGNLLVSELYAEEGCWSGYPPHKHDSDEVDSRDGQDDRTVETNHEELYHFRYRPETGFGAQFLYQEGDEPLVEMVRHGDSFAVPRGYHPTVTSPGHDEYIFTVLVGRSRRGLVQNFEPRHEHLVARIPGIAGMRKAFE
jgi:5-deoxy-glucuronate isomerase